MAHFIDRRLNGKNKSAVNRQRFIRRYKQQIKQAVSDAASPISILGKVSLFLDEILLSRFSIKVVVVTASKFILVTINLALATKSNARSVVKAVVAVKVMPAPTVKAMMNLYSLFRKTNISTYYSRIWNCQI